MRIKFVSSEDVNMSTFIQPSAKFQGAPQFCIGEGQEHTHLAIMCGQGITNNALETLKALEIAGLFDYHDVVKAFDAPLTEENCEQVKSQWALERMKEGHFDVDRIRASVLQGLYQ